MQGNFEPFKSAASGRMVRSLGMRQGPSTVFSIRLDSPVGRLSQKKILASHANTHLFSPHNAPAALSLTPLKMLDLNPPLEHFSAPIKPSYPRQEATLFHTVLETHTFQRDGNILQEVQRRCARIETSEMRFVFSTMLCLCLIKKWSVRVEV